MQGTPSDSVVGNKSFTLSALSDCYRLVDGVVKTQKKSSIQTTHNEKDRKEESFEKLFPSGSGGCGNGASKNVILIEPQLLRKTRRKLHYLLAFANENPILPSLS